MPSSNRAVLCPLNSELDEGSTFCDFGRTRFCDNLKSVKNFNETYTAENLSQIQNLKITQKLSLKSSILALRAIHVLLEFKYFRSYHGNKFSKSHKMLNLELDCMINTNPSLALITISFKTTIKRKLLIINKLTGVICLTLYCGVQT